jgi:hypothetical protein
MQKNYLREMLNYAEIAQSVLCFYVIWGIDYANELSDMDYWIQNIAYLLVIYRFFVYFLKFSTTMSRFILVIEEALHDLKEFLVYFVLLTYALTIPFMLVSRANGNLFLN